MENPSPAISSYTAEKLLEIINEIRSGNELPKLVDINESMNLREDIGLNSFDLAELTVKIEDEYDIDIFADGLVNTIGEVYTKLSN